MANECARVDAWLKAPIDVDHHDSLPPDDLVAHVASCSRCRALLVLLFASSAQVPAEGESPLCPRIEARLPAYVDLELAHGLGVAARSFPDVWWHTLVCQRCDELYRELRELAELPQAPRPTLNSQPPPKLQPLLRIQLPAGVLLGYVVARQSLGAQLGDSADELMLSEGEAEEVSVRVSMRHGPGGLTQLIVRTTPPIRGAAILSLGTYTSREPLDPDGVAIFAQLPETLLSDNPDTLLTVAIDQAP
jgi:hypothetical protein